MADKKALFEQIYFQYQLLVYNLALHYTLNPEDAEEITQDVFIKVYESLDAFKNNSSVKTWLYRITINHSLDFIKHKNSKKRFFIFGKRSASQHEYLNASDHYHPGIALEDREQSALLFKVLDTLPSSQKTAFLLSKLEGLGNPEIAAVMQLSISAVESLQVRAKKALREKLGEKFEEYRRKK